MQIEEIMKAKKFRDMNSKNWHIGSSLYELSEPVEVIVDGFLTETKYVIVAVTPKAVDHERPETTIFAANKNGSLFGNFWDKKSDNELDHMFIPRLGMDDGAEFEKCRVVGEYNHAKALSKLGYKLD